MYFVTNNQIVNEGDARGECFKRNPNKRNSPRNNVFERKRFGRSIHTHKNIRNTMVLKTTGFCYEYTPATYWIPCRVFMGTIVALTPNTHNWKIFLALLHFFPFDTKKTKSKKVHKKSLIHLNRNSFPLTFRCYFPPNNQRKIN